MIPRSAFGVGGMDQVGAFQRKWASSVSDILNKHRETLDTQYRACIRTIDHAFRAARPRTQSTTASSSRNCGGRASIV